MPSREMPGFPDQERTPEWLRMRTGKLPRTRTQLGPASSSANGGQNSSGNGAPTATTPINHVQIQRPRHQLLYVQCRDSGRQFLVDGSSTVTLWPQTQPPRDSWPVKVTLTSASGNTIPTFGSTMRELNSGSQLFLHNFICAKVFLFKNIY